MKFYKIHASKFNYSKIFFIPEQFDDIGPDSFSKVDFEVIIFSRRVKIIRNNAFTDLKNCKIYIPKTVSIIEPSAFEGIDEGNVFYCVEGSKAFEVCSENQVEINTDIDSLLKYANDNKPKEEEKPKPKKTNFEQPQSTDNDNIVTSNEVNETYENTNNDNIVTANEVNETYENTDENIEPIKEELPKKIENNDKSDEIFIRRFGLPPVNIDYVIEEGINWAKEISQMSSEEIIRNYEIGEFCEQYRNICYFEL